jgi:hypothetical protein
MLLALKANRPRFNRKTSYDIHHRTVSLHIKRMNIKVDYSRFRFEQQEPGKLFYYDEPANFEDRQASYIEDNAHTIDHIEIRDIDIVPL